MKSVVDKLIEHASVTPSKWREEAQSRRENKSWLRYSQGIAMKMLERMEEFGITQKELAVRMSCTQQYVSKVLKGRENLSLETLNKIEDALDICLVNEQMLVPVAVMTGR